jgi:hypothetical protein
MRETPLATWTLAPPGIELEATVQDRLIQAMMDDFKMLNPCIKNLKATNVQSRIAGTADGLVLTAWAKELPQLEFAFRDRNTSAVTDLFSLEVDLLQKSVRNNEEVVATALNPHLTPAEVRDLASVNPLLAHLRKRSKAIRTRTPVINEVGLASSIPNFALALVRRIEATVVALLPQHCKLQQVKIVRSSDDDITLVFPKSILMTRPNIAANLDCAMHLLSCLESTQTITIDSLVLLDWASGQPRSIEFRGFADNESHIETNGYENHPS